VGGGGGGGDLLNSSDTVMSWPPLISVVIQLIFWPCARYATANHDLCCMDSALKKIEIWEIHSELLGERKYT
jgi:hypothetical protein